MRRIPAIATNNEDIGCRFNGQDWETTFRTPFMQSSQEDLFLPSVYEQRPAFRTSAFHKIMSGKSKQIPMRKSTVESTVGLNELIDRAKKYLIGCLQNTLFQASRLTWFNENTTTTIFTFSLGHHSTIVLGKLIGYALSSV